MLSQSQNSLSRTTVSLRNHIISANYEYFDALFPLFNALTQNTTIPGFLNILCVIIQLFQFSMLAEWAYLLGNLEESNSLSFYRIINSILLFCGDYRTESNPFEHFVVLSIAFFILVLSIILQIISYHRTRTYSKTMLYILRIGAEFFAPVFLVPSATYIGWCLQLFINKKSSYALYYMIFTIIYYICFMIYFALSFKMISISPFLQTSIVSTWTSKYYIMFISSQTVFGFLSCFMENFPSWMIPITIILHIGTLIYHFVNIFNYYFIRARSNDLYGTVFLTNIIIDIIALISYFWPKVNYLVLFITMFVAFCIAYPLSKISLKIKGKTIMENLNAPQNESESIYESLGLKYSPEMSLCYLHFGVAEQCPRVVDFTLQKYLVGVTDSIEVFAELVKVACFFPQESRVLSHLSQALISKKTLPYYVRFMLYQAERIKSIRQSSSLVESVEVYNKAKLLGQTTFSKVVSFWKHLPYSTSTLNDINNSIRETENQWIEILNAYPNNNMFKEEYSKFLIDCKSDFVGGIHEKYFALQIENGVTYISDKAFKLFIRSYPQYLKKNIMDFKGNVITGKVARKGSTSSSSNRSSANFFSSSMSSSNIISQEVEEAIGKSLIASSKTRIAIHNAFYNRKSKYRGFMLFSNWFYIILISAMILLIYFVLRDSNISHNILIKHQISLLNISSSAAEIELFSYLRWAQMRGLLGNFSNRHTDEKDYLFEENKIDDLINETLSGIVFYLSNSTRLIANRANEGEDIFSTLKEYAIETSPTYMCEGSNVLGITRTTFPVEVMTFYYGAEKILDVDDKIKLQNSKHLCELITNGKYIHENVQNITGSNVEVIALNDFDVKHLYNIITVLCGVIIFVVVLVPLMVSISLFYSEEKKMITLLRKFSDAQRMDSIKRISLEMNAEVPKNTAMELDNKKEIHICLYILVFVSVAIVPIITMLDILFSYQYLYSFKNIYGWLYLSNARKTYCIQALSSLVLGKLLSYTEDGFDPSSFKAATVADQFRRLEIDLATAASVQNGLTIGNSFSQASLGITKELDRVNSNQFCDIIDVAETSHTFIKCGSITEKIHYLQKIAEKCVKDDKTLKDDCFYDLEHGIFNHLVPSIDKSTRLFAEYSDDLMYSHKVEKLIFMAISFVATFTVAIILYAIFRYFNKLYETLIRLTIRMPPNIFASNIELLNYLTNKETKEDNVENMSLTMKIIHGSNDAIVCTGITNDIEVINKSFTKLLGYTPEQVLGQNFTLMFDDQSNVLIEDMMQKMKNAQANKTYEDHVICIADDDSLINCKLTLIGMSQHDDSKATSFVFILTDETELINQQKNAEEEKKKSETLLYQILPMDIVLRLNRGEKNISFEVPFASIIFIDVQRFSEYTRDLSPSQIMGTLSTLFAAFDGMLIKYDSLTKIKLIGDTYMAAAGLFNPGENQKSAEQTLKLGLDVLLELDDINIKLGANLNVRIGINSGGPLIAGVLGTEKPVFDIIGDPINVAARLQSTDIAGKVQISQSTYDLTQHIDASFEKRGEVFLKGKGKSIAYLVTQNNPLTLVFSSSTRSGFLRAAGSEKD